MSKIYTCLGDEGTTRNLQGKTVYKDDCQIEVLGSLDSLMSQLDRVAYGLDILPKFKEELTIINTIRTLLWQLGGEISGQKIVKLVKTPIEKKHIEILEVSIDKLSKDFKPEFRRFSNPIAMDIDESRVRTRKLERDLTKYLRENRLRKTAYSFINRLSDFLYSLAVVINKKYSN